MEHGRTRRCDCVALRRPAVEWEKRNQDTETKEQKRKDIILHRFSEWMSGEVITQLQ